METVWRQTKFMSCLEVLDKNRKMKTCNKNLNCGEEIRKLKKANKYVVHSM